MQGLPVTPAEEQKGLGATPARKRKSIYDTITDTEMVERVFGFLPSMMGGQEGPAPPCFEVRGTRPSRVRSGHWGRACPGQTSLNPQAH